MDLEMEIGSVDDLLSGRALILGGMSHLHCGGIVIESVVLKAKPNKRGTSLRIDVQTFTVSQHDIWARLSMHLMVDGKPVAGKILPLIDAESRSYGEASATMDLPLLPATRGSKVSLRVIASVAARRRDL